MLIIEEMNDREDVYDISVPETDNFYANDILVHNCVEIFMWPKTKKGVSGWQGCNLVEINGAHCNTPEKLMAAARAASTIATLQAGYTNFKYLPAATKEIFEGEALIGVSITGWMNNPQVLFDKDTITAAAKIVVDTNKKIAKLININQAARTTTSKPSGNSSVILMTASGIGAEHAPRYLRHIQMNKEQEVGNLIKNTNPAMVENSCWSENDYVIAFPIIPPASSKFRKDLYGIKQLEFVKLAQQTWIETGTVEKLCRHPKLRHNISNTITVDNWDEVSRFVFDNKNYFAGISFLGMTGDKNYVQAPFTEVLSEQELIYKYGVASVFASGLIVDGLAAFNNDLWFATDMLKKDEDKREIISNVAIGNDWIRRAIKFADTYFNSDIDKMIYCLKDVHILHKWHKIINEYVHIEWNRDLAEKEYVDVDTLSGESCAGGTCDINF